MSITVLFTFLFKKELFLRINFTGRYNNNNTARSYVHEVSRGDQVYSSLHLNMIVNFTLKTVSFKNSKGLLYLEEYVRMIG